MRHLSAAVAICTLFPMYLLAQATPKPADENRPKLMVRDGDASKPLALAKADIHVVITGYIAQTTMTLTFHNEQSRVMEGELIFPLPEGATVSGYGLDVNGVMVDGVPVEKQKARITFETEVRKGVDPGLVEQVKGNNFRTRIYPIPAQGDRTVKVQYVSELIASDNGAAYTLPMNWGNQPVGQYAIKIEVVQPSVNPALGPNAPPDLVFEGSRNRLIAQKTYQNATFKDDLFIALPKMPAQHVVIEKRRSESGGAEEYYFVINDLPRAQPVNREVRQPRHIGILWDASLSRAAADKTRELDLLRKHLAGLGSISVDVVVFRNVQEPPVSFTTDKAADLLKLLAGTPCDGGTNLGQLTIYRNYTQFHPGRPVEETPVNYDYWLLFTDGLGNLFEEMPRTVEAPVYVIANDARANHTVLGHVAQSSGGRYFNLKRMDDDQVLAGIGQTPFAFISAEFQDGQIAEIYPRGVQPVAGRFALSGKLRTPEAKITLNYGVGTTVTHRSTYTLNRAYASETGLAARFWAQQKIADLAIFEEKNQELLALGREFNLVTPSSSLMVLETLAQYVEHRITPPKSRPDIYNAYVAQVEKDKVEQKKTADTKIDQVLAMWKQRVQWWEKEYTYAKDFKYKEPPSVERTGGGSGGFGGGFAGDGGAPTTRPSAPAPSVAAPAPAERPARLRAAAAGARFDLAQADLSVDALPAAAEPAMSGPAIAIKPWNPETPYLVTLRNTARERTYEVYLQQREKFGAGPSFYLDCADFFMKHKQPEIAVRILTDIAELELESAPLLRIAANRLAQIGQRDLAIDLFEKILKMRPEEPQSYRDLALSLSERAERDLTDVSPGLRDRARRDYTRAIDLLNQVVTRQHDERFPEIEVVVLMELNRLLDRAKTMDLAIPAIDERLRKLLDLDIRIVLTWDADATDIDLWVIEPSGEKCVYDHNRTTIGGLLSCDFTRGYGPEEYCLRRAMSGEYKIQANFYGSSQQKLVGPTTVQATIITNFGRPDEKRQAMTVRLENTKDVVDIGSIRLGEPQQP